MTTPSNSYTPGEYQVPVNAANSFTSGTAEFASWTKDDWDEAISALWEGKFTNVGNPLEVIRQIAHAIVAAFEGDWDPLKDLFADVTKRSFVGEVIDALFGGYHGVSTTGHTTAELASVGASIQNRITALEGGGVRYSMTSTTTINLTGKSKVKGVLIGSSTAAGAGGNDGGAGGTNGGFMEFETDVDYIASQVSNIAAVAVQIGTGGASSKFGQRADGTWIYQTTPGFSVKADGLSFAASLSGPGDGGRGGLGGQLGGQDTSRSPSSGSVGGSSVLGGLGGAGGGTNSNAAGSAGSTGSTAAIDGPVKGGGSGGGGGGGGDVINVIVTVGQNGGNGGNGGYPGGGPGGGGGRGIGANGSPGAAGAMANGYGEVIVS